MRAITASPSMRSGLPAAARLALPAATTSSISARASARSAGSVTIASVSTPPAATVRPLKGTFQQSFSQRARSNEG